MTKTQLDFDISTEGNLIHKLYKDKDLLHTEIVDILRPALVKYDVLYTASEDFFGSLTSEGMRYAGKGDATDIFLMSMLLKVDIGGLTPTQITCVDNKTGHVRRQGNDQLNLSAYAHYLLMTAYFDSILVKALMLRFIHSSTHIETIRDIHAINNGLTEGLDAWRDAVFLYYYRAMKSVKYTLAKSSKSARVTFSVTHALMDEMYTDAMFLLTGQELEGKTHTFDTRVDAIAFVKKLDEIHQRGKDLEAKYSV